MVQRTVPNKIGIKTHHHKSNSRLVNLKPSSSSSSTQTHEKMKIMKKSRSIKRSVESLPPFKKKKTQQLPTNEPGSTPATPQKQSPNYMKSTTSFDARKEQSPKKTPELKGTRNSKANDQSATKISSLKTMRSLTKTTSFKPLRLSKKVILCEDIDVQRATCSSTLKESKFPNYLQLDPGGTELDGTSAMKVCPYTYCSLNGHHHAPVQPLKCFISARKRALKSQKGFKLGCLSPRQMKPNVTKFVIGEPVISAAEEEKTELFIGDQDLEFCDIDWEGGYCSDSGLKLQEIDEDKIVTTSVERLYDEESVSSGAWSEEDGDSASDSWCEEMKINQDCRNYDAVEESDTTGERQGSKTVPDLAESVEDESEKNDTRIIYNIIQFNISVFVNGDKTEDREVIVKKTSTCVAGDTMTIDEAMEERGMNENEVNQMVADEELSSKEVLTSIEKDGNPVQECDDFSQPNSMDEEPAIISDMAVEMTSETINSFDTKSEEPMDNSFDTKSEAGVNLKGLKNRKEEILDDSLEFNPRGPNFLPETPDPDAETVDLRHQMMDERKNAEEWMVDFALQQAVTTLAPARNRKVALLVEAFEKVMPPDPVRRNRHISKAFTNSRPMQACS